MAARIAAATLLRWLSRWPAQLNGCEGACWFIGCAVEEMPGMLLGVRGLGRPLLKYSTSRTLPPATS